jgi:LysR family transcriptional regulator for metE and metH
MRLTTSCFTSYGWLPTAVTKFGASHPNVELDIVIEATRRAVPALLADEVDLAIVTQPPTDDTWQRVPVVESELVTIASRSHPVVARVKRGCLKWDALAGSEIYVHDISDADLARLTRAVAHPVTVRKIPLSEALLDLARAGRGVAIVDRWTVESQLGKDLVALAMTPRAPRTFYACWRRSNPRGLPIRELIAAIEDASAKTVNGP